MPPAVGDADEGDDAGPETEWRDLAVQQTHHGQRLDKILVDLNPEFSRSYLQQLVQAGAVTLNVQSVLKVSTRVKAGDSVKIELRPTPQSQSFKPETMPLAVVFEDEHLLVINKTAGLVVHPAPGNWSGTLLNGLLNHYEGAVSVPRAGIVHRLDKDTSGLMVVAKSRSVMDSLVSMIAKRHVSRQYLALAHGPWNGAAKCVVNEPIGRDPRNRLRMAVVDSEKGVGKDARTTFELIDSAERSCLVRCTLHTGRTHQIRVHMAFLGHPLVADRVYGGAELGGMRRQTLHAYRLAFIHPVTGVDLVFKAAVPSDMAGAISDLGLRYNEDSGP